MNDTVFSIKSLFKTQQNDNDIKLSLISTCLFRNDG